MRFASLGSGSQGNALIVEAGGTRLMLDCGFPLRETVSRLARAGLDPSDLAGIIVTHEHADHGEGVFPLACRFGLPVWLTHGTLSALRAENSGVEEECELNLVDSGRSFSVGDLLVHPFTVPHDAREPVQYVLSDGARRLGVLTDTGCSTAHVESNLSGCDALVLECNHDLGLLTSGPYPSALKVRIASRLGHLDNQSSASLLAALDRGRLKHLIAAHLSQTNNTPELARAALAAVMRCEPGWISVATQDEGFGWRDL
ncbi:MAG: MBL fold metallo-hydrolase [Betaproteobacteria bacterium]|nr:MAG: MBL fold metallo-hydrolase [Betaproteobacteria bacterium]